MKEKILECARFLFVTLGPRRVGLDELAHQLGISKKTIYKYFSSKEHLVECAIALELENIRGNLEEILGRRVNPVRKVLMIYYFIIQELQQLNPAFLREVQAYYPPAYSLIEDFRATLIDQPIMALLKEAKQTGMIHPHVDEKLFVRIHLSKISQVMRENKLYFQTEYSVDTLFEHLILSNVKGILSEEYSLSTLSNN